MEIILFILLSLLTFVLSVFICLFVLNKIDKLIFNYCRKKVNKMNIKIEKNG